MKIRPWDATGHDDDVASILIRSPWHMAVLVFDGVQLIVVVNAKVFVGCIVYWKEQQARRVVPTTTQPSP